VARRRRANGAPGAGPLSIAVAFFALVASAPSSAASYPVLPAIDGSQLLSGLSSPVVSPGAGGSVAMTLGDPLSVAILSVVVVVELYEFNAYPGNATGPVPVGGLSLGAAGGASGTNFTFDALAPGTVQPLTVPFTTSASAPQGAYALRVAVDFSVNGTAYRFESRGWFSESVWENATQLPGGGSTLNLTRLGVSGVVPETGVLVRSNPYSPWLDVLVVGALVLAAAGGYYATRAGPGSSSGARPETPERSAPNALGNSRTRDGD
jgi:hypothetical protein